MSDTNIHSPLTTVIVNWRDPSGSVYPVRPVSVPAEPTSNPHLAITPTFHNGRLAGGWQLTHIPTGWTVFSDKLGVLRAVAGKVEGLDWSFTDGTSFPGSEIARATREAIMEVRTTEPDGMTLPAHDTFGPDGKGKGLHRTALPMIEDFLADFQRAYDLIDAGEVPACVPNPEAPGGKCMNPDWRSLDSIMIRDYGLAYLLAALHRVDPAVADSAAAGLADAWAAGDSLGEWVDEWRKQMAEGKPLDLPGIPGPLGDLFTPDAAR